ncbi:MAG TPA: TolC family protein, partial [Flavobacterium sp.]|uniref:TolC family protein n=1 Tax=Flavobacterium sp. TaxID=239 RepID=UPI002B9CAAD7
MTHTKILFQSFILILFSVATANAQEVLTLQSAVKIALENNYEIKIATNNLTIEKTKVAIGNAGMLPTVTANIVDNNGIQNSSQTRQDGTKTELDNAKNNSLTYGVGLDWTIFDGMRMFAKLDQLKELQNLGEAQLKLTIITRISEVTAAYYDLVQQQQQLAALDTTIVISKQ